MILSFAVFVCFIFCLVCFCFEFVLVFCLFWVLVGKIDSVMKDFSKLLNLIQVRDDTYTSTLIELQHLLYQQRD